MAGGSASTGESRTSGLSIASLVFGILGLMIAPLGIAAVITGHMGLRRARQDPARKGDGVALAGVILGYLDSALFLISIIAIGVLILLGHHVAASFKTMTPEISSFEETRTAPADSVGATNTPDTNAPTTNAAPAHP